MSDTRDGRDRGASGGWNLGQKAPQSSQSATSTLAHWKKGNRIGQEHDDALVPSPVVPSQCRYKYSPLSENEIRLLTLLPGRSRDSEIRVTLASVLFTSDTTLDFEALSYTWGSTENNVDIFVGETGNDTLSMTKNLAQVLPYLRYADKPRVLWIDAISVNQEDLDERSNQVRRMPEIYSKATRVVIWLGLESFDSRMSFECLRLMASKYHVDWETYTVDPVIKNESLWAMPHEIMPLSEEQYRSILNLIDRSWFERLWVWQEARLANETSVVVCGNDAIPWTIVCEAMFCLLRKPLPLYFFSAFAKRFDTIQHLLIRTSRVDGFSQLLKQTKFCKCADPRDKVYALLGMLGEKDQLGIEPDYTKSVDEVYKDTALRLIYNTGSLDVLRHIELNDSNKLPSWVPDWKTPRGATSFGVCNASGASAVNLEYIAGPGDLLKVTGRFVSRIAQVEPFYIDRYLLNISHLLPQLRLIASKLGILENCSKSRKYIPALCEILCSNQFSDRFMPPRTDMLDFLEMEQGLRKILESQDEAEGIDGTRGLFSHMRVYCYGRSLLLTEDGCLGLAPQAVKAGDLVTVLLGCVSSMILRPVTSDPMCHSKQRYKVVGEAYCHGIMQGEAILGPLPGLFDTVWQFNDNSRGYELVCMIARRDG
ncbi:heterokaryon incompatibility protein-domain-containing protein [Leptodontidium sp. MPI-SDFR-AT-0119]|nr:heterokaryon incompatibility protein-domain-containing protein [Leptodontidium sp. MPI-SDFR-AT-0119]